MSSVTASTQAEASSAPEPARRGRLRAPVELEVVIPAYNESGRLPETLRQSVAYLDRQPWRSRIVVVDNGSVDDTAADARDGRGGDREGRRGRDRLLPGRARAPRSAAAC